MKQRLMTIIVLMLLVGSSVRAENTIPDDASAVTPIKVGQQIPSLQLTSAEGKIFDVNQALKKQPTLLILYRGGWCPYCNTHLANLRKIENELTDKGVQIFAISPDLPEYLRETDEKHQLGYTLLSDSKMTAAKALGLAFKVNTVTQLKYKTFGIDLERNSGEEHHLLPVPSAILVDQKQTVRFIFYSPNYKIRIENAAILDAVNKLTNEHAEQL